MHGARSVDDLFGFLASHLDAQARVVLSLESNGCGDFFDDIARVLLRFAQKWIQECRVAGVIPEFPMLEEDVYGFP